MTNPILLAIDDGIALVTLNRPERLNALSYALIDQLMAALDRIEGDDAVRAVILTGAGERAFSAGADIHEFERAGFSHVALHNVAQEQRGFIEFAAQLT